MKFTLVYLNIFFTFYSVLFQETEKCRVAQNLFISKLVEWKQFVQAFILMYCLRLGVNFKRPSDHRTHYKMHCTFLSVWLSATQQNTDATKWSRNQMRLKRWLLIWRECLCIDHRCPNYAMCIDIDIILLRVWIIKFLPLNSLNLINEKKPKCCSFVLCEKCKGNVWCVIAQRSGGALCCMHAISLNWNWKTRFPFQNSRNSISFCLNKRYDTQYHQHIGSFDSLFSHFF